MRGNCTQKKSIIQSSWPDSTLQRNEKLSKNVRIFWRARPETRSRRWPLGHYRSLERAPALLYLSPSRYGQYTLAEEDACKHGGDGLALAALEHRFLGIRANHRLFLIVVFVIFLFLHFVNGLVGRHGLRASDGAGLRHRRQRRHGRIHAALHLPAERADIADLRHLGQRAVRGSAGWLAHGDGKPAIGLGHRRHQSSHGHRKCCGGYAVLDGHVPERASHHIHSLHLRVGIRFLQQHFLCDEFLQFQ